MEGEAAWLGGVGGHGEEEEEEEEKHELDPQVSSASSVCGRGGGRQKAWTWGFVSLNA